jgi:hypothetical protein
MKTILDGRDPRTPFHAALKRLYIVKTENPPINARLLPAVFAKTQLPSFPTKA